MTCLASVKYWRLPDEMQQRAQWCLAGPDKAPCLAGPEGLYHASPVKGPWLDFETACIYAKQYNTKIGFIITENDPYTCIDMDVKDIESKNKAGELVVTAQRSTIQSLGFYSGIVEFAQSYTELSASGKGLHVWVKGDIGAGRRGKGIEIYSKERFIICTGDTVSAVSYHILNGVAIAYRKKIEQVPIEDGSLLLANLVKDLTTVGSAIELVETEASMSDEEIWQKAMVATNSDKFKNLCGGMWQQYGFPSQSEADLALLSMFTFYTKSNDQCRRMFRATKLGERDKAICNDVYLDRTLRIIRSRQANEKASTEHGQMLAQGLLNNMQTTTKVNPKIADYVMHLNQAQHTEPKPNIVDYKPPEVDGLEWPPGLVGAIAGYIYQSAPRPVKEVAIVAALGLVSGIAGKAYNIGQTGLNLYIILIARSAIGKEAMHSGIGHILRSPCGHALNPFVDFTDYASGPALTKAMESRSCFVNVSGEWGRKLQRMADDKRDGPMQQLRTVMTNLYQKSGAASVMGGLGYSNKDQNVKSVNAVAYSMIGETTPGTFYDSLTPTMMEDGFLSRFNIIEYLGERPKENKNQLVQVPQQISDALAEIASHCIGVISGPTTTAIQIKFCQESKELFNDFNDYCDGKINEAGGDESIRQIWNRAHLKASRVAAILAAADNHLQPEVNITHSKWALELIKADAFSMLSRIQGGDIGIDDTSRFKKLQAILGDYLRGKIPKSHKINSQMIKEGVVPRKFLQARSCQIRCFRNYRLGATLALDHTVKTAIDSGYMIEIGKEEAIKSFGYHGRAFRVLEIGEF